jgi:hypothetical protein
VVTRDGADRLVDVAVRLLPPGRGQWGAAMRAELAAVGTRAARWSFALGCVRAAVGQRPRARALRSCGYPMIMVGVVYWTSGIADAALHWGLVALAGGLLMVAWLGRRPGLLGPVAPGRAARGVRAGWYVLLGVLTVGVAVSMSRHGDQAEQARNGVPVFAVLLSSYLLGVLTVTARRSAATGRTLLVGTATGAAAAVAWTLVAVLFPPMPVDVAPTAMLIAVAMVVAGVIAGRGGEARRGMLAVCCAGPAAALLVVIAVAALSTWGPAVLIPDLAPAALTPADDLAQSRAEVQDPYVAVLLLGCVLSWLLASVSLATRSPLDRPRRA